MHKNPDFIDFGIAFGLPEWSQNRQNPKKMHSKFDVQNYRISKLHFSGFFIVLTRESDPKINYFYQLLQEPCFREN